MQLGEAETKAASACSGSAGIDGSVDGGERRATARSKLSERERRGGQGEKREEGQGASWASSLSSSETQEKGGGPASWARRQPVEQHGRHSEEEGERRG